jgi:hypothetical protein
LALEGTFSDFGLAEIFQLIGLQKKTGVLTVRGGEDGQVVTVSFDKGMVAFADEYQRSETERLGSILIRSQLITREALDKAVTVQKETLQRLGHVLTQMGFITQQELRRALQTQVKEAVYRLFRWKEGSYHFSPEAITYDKEMYQPVSAEFLLMEGVRMIDEWPIIEKKITSFSLVFEKVPGKEFPVKAAPRREAGEEEWDDLMAIVEEEAGGDGGGEDDGEGSSRLSAPEKAIYGLVDGVRSVQELIDIGKVGEFETCKVLYGFLSVGLVRQVREEVVMPSPRAARRRPFLPLADMSGVLLFTGLLCAALLFNPWSLFALNYNVLKSRSEIGALRDDVKIERLHHALHLFYLEKQSYPHILEKLAEDRLLRGGDLRDHRGRLFGYRAGEKGYQLVREEVPDVTEASP